MIYLKRFIVIYLIRFLMIYLETFIVIYLIKISNDIPGNIYYDIPHKDFL